MKIVFEGNQEEVIAEIIAMALVLAPVKVGAGLKVVPDPVPGKEEPPVETEYIPGADGDTPVQERKPGFPADGKTRRTKAQIAEDEAYFKAQGEPTDDPGTAEEATTETVTEPEPDANAGTDAGLTLDDVRNKLKMVVSMTSMKRGQELVAEFEASRITELPEEKFAAFIARCEVVAEEG